VASPRKARREARAAIEATIPGGPRTAHTQDAGDAILLGDPPTADLLLRALRMSGPVDRATHGFHTYPAGLHPDAARLLLELAPGPVLDPFCGGGTVLVEAMLAGRPALGLDVSAVACLVARARTRRTTEADRTALRVAAREAAAAARAAVFAGAPLPEVPPAVARAYDAPTLVELAALAERCGDEGLRAVLSAIVVKVSRRASDTDAGWVDRPRALGTTATFFHAKAREYARRLEALEALPAEARARVHREDARGVRLRERFGLVLTSPPYPGIYDYVPLQALRRFWLGLDDHRAEQEEMGSRRDFRRDPVAAAKAWREDTHRWIKAARRGLDVGGRLVVVVGDNRVGRRLDSRGAVVEAARANGMVHVASATVERWDEGIGVVHLEHAIAMEVPSPSTPGMR